MRRLAVILTILCLVILCIDLRAAELSNGRIGNWSTGAYSNDQTGQFSHCAAITRYNSGILMAFAVNRNYGWSVGFSKPEWQLQTGSKYPIAFTVDRIPALNATALAISPNLVEVNLADSVALFNVFRRGNLLTVFAAGQLFQFSLTDTSRLLPILVSCVRDHLVLPPQQSANPFASPAPPVSSSVETKPSDTADSASQAEATSFLANVLSHAGVAGFTILTPEQALKLKADAAWKAQDTFGTLTIVKGQTKIATEEITSALVASDAKVCHGKFLSGAMPEDKEEKGLRLFTACTANEKTTTALYSVLPRSEGGYYVFATVGIDASKDDPGETVRSIDTNIRTAAFRILPK